MSYSNKPNTGSPLLNNMMSGDPLMKSKRMKNSRNLQKHMGRMFFLKSTLLT